MKREVLEEAMRGTKRIGLQPAPLSAKLARCPGHNGDPDCLDVTIERGGMHVVSLEVERGRMAEPRHLDELAPSERNQVHGLIVAEWLDWKPFDIGDSMTSETILDVFARLKKSLEDKGLVAGGEVAE